jgi:hypothetical protein
MAYTTTTRLGLQKAVIGSNQAFETSAINNNWDKLDSEAIAQDGRLDTLEASTLTQDSRLTSVEGVNSTQNTNITALQTKTNSGTVYDAARVGGRTIFAQSTTPTALATGDIWIQTP